MNKATEKVQPFEENADRYEDWFERNYLAYQSELQAVKEHLPREGDGLEIGIGSGRFAGPLGINFGIDPSSKMRMLAEERGLKVVDAKAEKLPFQDVFFSFVLMITTICFLDDTKKAFKEINRVLKPKGKVVVGFVDKDSFLGKKYQQHKEKNIFYKSATFYSVDEVFTFIKEAGFEGFNFSQTLFHHPKDIQAIELSKKGYGQGAFVVISAFKL